MADAMHDDFLARYGQAWSAGDERAFAEMLTEDARYLEAGMGVNYEGRERVLSFFRFMLKFSPDSVIKFTDFTHDADSFVAEWMWSGTVAGPLRLGDRLLQPRYQSFAVPGVALCRFGTDQRVAYHKDIYDVRDLLAQLGLDGDAGKVEKDTRRP